MHLVIQAFHLDLHGKFFTGCWGEELLFVTRYFYFSLVLFFGLQWSATSVSSLPLCLDSSRILFACALWYRYLHACKMVWFSSSEAEKQRIKFKFVQLWFEMWRPPGFPITPWEWAGSPRWRHYLLLGLLQKVLLKICTSTGRGVNRIFPVWRRVSGADFFFIFRPGSRKIPVFNWSRGGRDTRWQDGVKPAKRGERKLPRGPRPPPPTLRSSLSTGVF